MSTKFTVPARVQKDRFNDVVSINDAITYEFDFTAWQEDNNTITSATWTVETGNASVSNESLSSGVASALLTFSESGYSLISILVDTGTEKKKVWLETSTKDMKYEPYDYGLGTQYV